MTNDELELWLQENLGASCAIETTREFARRVILCDADVEERLLALRDRHETDTLLRETLMDLVCLQLGMHVAWPTGRTSDQERAAFFDEYALAVQRAGMKLTPEFTELRLPWRLKKKTP